MSQQPSNSRRKFIGNSVKGSIAIGIGMTAASDLLASCAGPKILGATAYSTGFDQQPLPYAYDALENVIDAKTMELHYSKHGAAYAKALKEAAAAENVAATTPLETLLPNISKYSTKMRNNAGGHYNHEMFWKSLRPKRTGNAPTGTLLDAINKNFTSFDAFKKTFSDAGKNRFGSGWAWLYMDTDKNLKIGSTPNQDNPVMNVSEIKGFPLLGLDVWEHAYYLKYQNKRPDYIENWWNVVNWDYVAERFGKV